MGTIVWGPDVSNYDSPTLEQQVSCVAGQSTAPPVVRISEESDQLREISVNQITALEGAGRSTMGYGWAYASDDPGASAQAMVSTVDGHMSVKRIWLDVEDYTNFIKPNSAPSFVPRRIMATLEANGYSVAQVSQRSEHGLPLSDLMVVSIPYVGATKKPLSAISPVQAVNWIRTWVNEIRTLGYTPGIYSAPGVWKDLCNNDTSFGDVDGWGATWNNNPVPTPNTPWGGITNWIGTQYLAGNAQTPAICNMVLDLNAWDADLLATQQPPVQPPSGGSGDSGTDLQRLNQVLIWRLTGLTAAFATLQDAFGKVSNAATQLAYYTDPNNVPPES